MLSRLPQQQALTWTSSPARQLPIIRSQFNRFYSDKGTNPSVAPSSPPSPRQPTIGDVTTPSAISSATPGISQPLSTPDAVHIDGTATKPVVERPPSSCPAGTKMNGLNYFKNKPEILAKEDSEYPDWLWDLLGDSSKSKAKEGGIDPSTLNKKQRKRYEKKLAARVGVLPPKIPAHHHAHDITPAQYNRDGPSEGITDATESAEQRIEVTKSARQARRKTIKESNFLRGL
ncbi:Ribosomal protein L37 mitochondrial [Penicillium verhagenii]|uniref:Ribosomal protein L37 mitochondrial n=1 Tax=Penicillium verhagenii TaxID=1562060 RepID=UPI0025458877|nr:Ribosomal protein L37 mitochondrial [Penicillium verhagenii]KAJ5930607.1 Ribosomal protein L37 mitochondrial [Penicillium verhagenii]